MNQFDGAPPALETAPPESAVCHWSPAGGGVEAQPVTDIDDLSQERLPSVRDARRQGLSPIDDLLFFCYFRKKLKALRIN